MQLPYSPGQCRIRGMNGRVLLGTLASILASCTMVHASNAGPHTGYISEGGSWSTRFLHAQRDTALTEYERFPIYTRP
jgi:hypothetical protein